MDSNEPRRRLNVRVDPDLHDRATAAAEKHFQGSEAMLMREALATYLDLREQLGLRFALVVEPLRTGDLAVAS